MEDDRIGQEMEENEREWKEVEEIMKECKGGKDNEGILLRNRVIVWVYKFVYKTNEGMRVSEEFTSSLQVA